MPPVRLLLIEEEFKHDSLSYVQARYKWAESVINQEVNPFIVGAKSAALLPKKPDVRGCQCESCSFDSLEIPVENEAQKPLNHYKTNV